MNESERNAGPTSEETANTASPQPDAAALRRQNERQQTRRFWIKLFVQPVLFIACGAILLMGLGVAQRLGFISAGGSVGDAPTGSEAVSYICPMMCTPPQSEPGRCPVCAMELVPATAGGGSSGSDSIQIDPAARRVANIRTVAVKSMPITRTIRSIGELRYDEGSLKTLSAYVDGRIDRLYADYTGVVVKKGDNLALVYSPRLYSSQVELLLAKKARQQSRSSTISRVIQSTGDLYESARQRLIELGMTRPQIEQLERTQAASSRMHLCAPISGTVIEKFAVEGQYVKEGQAIYKLADLSTVWLLLELFPEEAAAVCYGQRVEAQVQSLPGRKFTGRVAFIDPHVDPKTRTVSVRVVIANKEGRLRIGDYAKATIEAAARVASGGPAEVYDPELANKWISPRHPHVVESSPGKCRVCGVKLVPAARFGFTDQPKASHQALVVPRHAVLMAGDASVVYVETAPGRFELRRVVLGPSFDNRIVILEGVEKGEQVAVRGNFLIDSQMQLAGNPSLIDPTKVEPILEFEWDETDLPPISQPQMVESPPADGDEGTEITQSLSKLPAGDQRLVQQQKVCPVGEKPLGSMGTPVKVDVNGRPVFICCEGCRQKLLAQPRKYLAKLPKSGDLQ